MQTIQGLQDSPNATETSIRPTVRQRLAAIGVTMADQVMVSGANFLMNVLLLKALGLAEFGIFALGWLVAMVAMSIQLGLVVCPMMSIGPKLPEDQGTAYYTAALMQIGAFTMLAFVLVLSGAVLYNQRISAGALDHLALPLAAATATTLLQDGVRRILFTRGRTLAVLVSDTATHSVRLATFGWVAVAGQTLTVSGALLVIAATAAVGAVIGVGRIAPFAFDFNVIRRSAIRHWASGRWLAASGIMQWFLANAFVMAAGTLLGPAAAGILRAGQTLVGVLNVLLQAQENILPQRASRALMEGGYSGLSRIIGVAAVVSLVPGVALVAILSAAPGYWMGLIFGPELEPYGAVLVLQSLTMLLIIVGLLPLYGLRALEQTRSGFTAPAVGCLLSIAIAIPFIQIWGVVGAAAGQLLAQTVMALWLGAAFASSMSAAYR